MATIDGAFNRDVRPYLGIIDSLRRMGIHHDLSLPQIAVMGDQSSGKSSVLQSISGIPFPRGAGLVTRCPTQLIMSKSPSGTQWKASVSVNWKLPTQPPGTGNVNSVLELASTISQLTDILTQGKQNNFSTDIIVVRVSSPDSPDLTIIDLPGIVRTATQGQDRAVIEQVNNLIQYYMSQPNTIILAVVPSNQDIATVDILERAAQVDPLGIRTLGVLTKPDLIGAGSEEEVVQVLRNTKKPLKLGYVMLKNLSQLELGEKLSAQEAREREAAYFSSHPHFSTMPLTLFGVEHLTVTLTKLLVSSIKRALPGMKWELERLLEDTARKLSLLGGDVPTDERDKQSTLMEKVAQYCKLLRLSSRGDYKEDLLASIPETRLHAKLQKSYKSMQESIARMRPLGVTSPEVLAELEVEMNAQKGRELPGFLSSQVFYGQIIGHVERWRPLVDQCMAEVAAETRAVVVDLASAVMPQLPKLAIGVQTIATDMIQSMSDETMSRLEALLAREQDPYTAQDILLEVVNGIRLRAFETSLRQILEGTNAKPVAAAAAASTSSSSNNSGNNKQSDSEKGMVGGAAAVSAVEATAALRDDVKKRLGAWYMNRHGVNNKGNVQEMATIIQAYWDVASRRLIDNVCMCIEMEFTSNLVRELETRSFLYSVSMDRATVDDILQEDPVARERRQQLSQKVDRLRQALATLKESAPDVVSRPTGS